MNKSSAKTAFIVFFRLALGWTFLYAGVSQLLMSNFSAAGFLNATKTFHPFFAWFATPEMLPYTDPLVMWGHTLIGLSLLSGLLVRYSAVCGAMLLGVYYFAHMDFPYVDGPVNFIMEYHLIYIGVLITLVVLRAGEVFGLDGWLANRATHRLQVKPILAARPA
jgi:thiosulfate dehydrogenase [quinone] large subunit